MGAVPDHQTFLTIENARSRGRIGQALRQHLGTFSLPDGTLPETLPTDAVRQRSTADVNPDDPMTIEQVAQLVEVAATTVRMWIHLGQVRRSNWA